MNLAEQLLHALKQRGATEVFGIPDFGLEQLVMVGDRGMISNKAIDELREGRLRAQLQGAGQGGPPHAARRHARAQLSTLLAELATIVRNTCRTPHAGPDAPTFEVLTTPNPKQQRAFELLQQIRL